MKNDMPSWLEDLFIQTEKVLKNHGQAMAALKHKPELFTQLDKQFLKDCGITL